ncbi:hypothetical protein DPMN_104714 [Dreissena polymorpha]|uniref:Secreted protein n=1 Tax=Dreissena polymorpha TaxID=45954 RepID=A0A9D4HAZ2_DREPO|nr:hypothetical protein DPMN_104714 [Dreissena polymorpha]
MKRVLIQRALLLIVCVLLPSATGNGRLLVPPQRSSLLREPQFYNNYAVYRNYDDHTLDCGGYWVRLSGRY